MKSNNTVRLEGNLLGCWNGLTSHGWVENNQGEVIWEYSHDPEDEGYFPLFSKDDFAQFGGFKLVEGERAEDFCQYPDNW
ncbi:MAG: hypothetical protein ACKPA7_20015 [Sphaerospermopsis kisseleviana]